ncbi:MAG TPA: adenylate/guanylate cyclase domain-containing protein [Streptosporangiaceae bacterium]|nr:adenylate/guanylate cyclase domain-containing protein [Streptosporangiaceae bacterium]
MLTFDKRGTGLSDPVPASELPSIEEWMDDLRTVMDESGIDRAVLVANLASSFMAMVFAATYPARVRALVMVNAYPRFTRADDYPGDAALVEQESRYERQAASPGTAMAMTRMINLIDVRSVLPTITVPTMVISRADPAAVPAAHRPTGGRTRPGPGDDLVHRHFGSTRLAAEHGDRAWRELLERHHALVRSELARFRGREVDTAGDGFLAVFDGPGRAVRCASAAVRSVQSLGIEIRAGVHTGEVEVVGEGVRGIAVHIGARVSALASASEVLVSSTVRDLVAGSGLQFEDRGSRELKGVPDPWRVSRS